MTSTRQQIIDSLSDREFRDLFVDEQLIQTIAFQIRAMRKARNWSQADLAHEIGSVQEVISKLENPDYGRFTLSTLRRLRAAFDVGLVVQFVPFSAMVDKAARLEYADLAVPDYDHDYALLSSAVQIDQALPTFGTSITAVGTPEQVVYSPPNVVQAQTRFGRLSQVPYEASSLEEVRHAQSK